MSNLITFSLDDQRVEVAGSKSNTTLLNYLRDELIRKGTKEGCAEGDCGACTVVVVDLFEGQLRYRSMNSCIQLMGTLDGKILYTIESLKTFGGSLHQTQRAMVDCHGSQCGFCTPGFVMSLFALFKSVANPTRAEISDAISGNLCRCTGYRPILDAGEKMYTYPPNGEIRSLDLPYESEGLQPLEQKLISTLQSLQEGMADKEFSNGNHQFFAPTSIKKLSSLRLEHPDAHLLAGGTDIGLWQTKKHMDLDKVIYIGKVPELETTKVLGDTIQIGAMVTLERALKILSTYYPPMLDMYKRFASLPIRNAGTLVGNIANGSPIGDSMPALIVLGSSILLRKGQQTRTLPMDEFYLDYMKKDLLNGEFIEAVLVPLPNLAEPSAGFKEPSAGFKEPSASIKEPSASSKRHHDSSGVKQTKQTKRLGVYKISKRFEQDISAVFAAFYVDVQQGRVSKIRICYGGMAAIPKRAINCENVLLKQLWNHETIELAVDALELDYQPLSDMRASALYRSRVAKNLLRKFYLENADFGVEQQNDKPIDVRNVLDTSQSQYLKT